jgi:hypothetical protein
MSDKDWSPMASQDSDSALAGKVAATLTPPIVHVPARRGEQSSGFFDLRSLYSMHVEAVRPRPQPPPLPPRAHAPTASRRPPPLPVARPARPLRELDADPTGDIVVPVLLPYEPEVDLRHGFVPIARRAARPRPIGWFAVFVTWVATATLGVLSATQVPAHRAVRARVSPVAAAAAPAIAPAVASASAPAPAAASASATPPASTTPVLSVSDLPRAVATPAAVHRVVRHVRAAPAREAPPPAAPATAAPEPAAQAAPPPPKPAAAVAAPPAPAAGSLEDLIRREVAAEQKRLHGAGAK